MARAQKEVSSQEFIDWQAYLSIEPHGFHVDEWRWGMLAANLCNAIRSTIPLAPGKYLKQFKPSDFYYPMQTSSSELTPGQRAYIERKKNKRKAKRG